MATIKKQAEITSPTINRVESKDGKCLGYLVKSDSQANTYYQVTWSNEFMGWRCSCPSRVSCKHIRAVREYAMIRYQHEHGKEEVLPTSQKGHLNGSTQGFSLMKK